MMKRSEVFAAFAILLLTGCAARAQSLTVADVQTVIVKDGDHRLSRESDLALLVATVSTLMESL